MMQGNQVDHPLVHLDVQPVDLLLGLEDVRVAARVALEEAFDGPLDHRLGVRPHLDQPALQLLELILEMAMDSHQTSRIQNPESGIQAVPSPSPPSPEGREKSIPGFPCPPLGGRRGEVSAPGFWV